MKEWVGIIIFVIVVAGWLFVVGKIGDGIAMKIEEALFGDHYKWRGTRRTYRHYTVVFAIVLAAFIGVKTHNAAVGIIAYPILSIVLWVLWRLIFDDLLDFAVDKAGDKLGDAVEGAIDKRRQNKPDADTNEPTKLSDRYDSK